jgi:hypothetical protein
MDEIQRELSELLGTFQKDKIDILLKKNLVDEFMMLESTMTDSLGIGLGINLYYELIFS